MEEAPLATTLHDMQNPAYQWAESKPVEGDSPSRSRPHLGAEDVRQGYIMIILSFLLAVLVAYINHVLFSRLDGTETGNHASQFGVTVAKNIFPAAVGLLLLIGLKQCLSQAALYLLRLSSHPLSLVNLITSPPSFQNTFSILFQSSLRLRILWFVLLTAIAQAVALASLFVPGALTVRHSPSRVQSLEVPTIDFGLIDQTISCIDVFASERTENSLFFGLTQPSPLWRSTVSRAALSPIAPTWDPPAGCSSGCAYNFSYYAPALKPSCQNTISGPAE
ncbi:hypothetical protein D9757_006733 [Collybiopsis confluens]|uniref:Uncharacterized protein n=1 Tax=Collybiopsis confluens TaxID=2823264 RepID=A0A8H5HLN5_9AGAR|nr:hypothetical protein D9757_006733 [Collybiopsis confluens]